METEPDFSVERAEPLLCSDTQPPPGKLCPCRRAPAQHPVDRLRGHQSAAWLLRRHVRRDAQPGPVRATGPALSELLVHRPGLRAGPHHDHHRRLSHQHRRRAHAQRGGDAGLDEDVSAASARARLLLHQQQQGGLQPDQARQGVGRVLPQGALEEPQARPAVLRRLQHRGHPREPDPRAARTRSSTTRPRLPCPPIIPTRPRCATTGPSTTTRSPRWTAIRQPPEGAGGRRPDGRHDRLLLRRPRQRHAAQQALALQLRPARAADRPRAGEIQSARAQGLRARRRDRAAGGLRRFRPHAAEPRRRASRRSGCRATPSWANSRRRRSRTCTASAAAWTSATTWSARSRNQRYVYIRNYMPH